ncbi:MAG TPA: transporter [Candidatus Binatia bacterium]|jgi:hypothetical protein|nr:transporter [Candidatus Binatia bacterium]
MLKPRHFLAFTSLITVSVSIFATWSRSEARSLTDVLVQGFSFTVARQDSTLAARAAAPAFSAAVAQAVAQEFPRTSVPPAFPYRFDPVAGTFERQTGVPGPLFSERALTLGRGQLNLSVGYAFVDFSKLNGTDLHNIRSPALLNEIFSEEALLLGRLTTGEPVFFAPTAASLIHTQIDLQAHIAAPTLRYGLTDRWDVSIAIPIVSTLLRVRNDTVRVADLDFPRAGFLFAKDTRGSTLLLGFGDPAGNPIRDVSRLPFVKSQRPSNLLARAAGSATGVGDIALRTKYHLWRTTKPGGAALGLTLQLPSGQARDFHGTDETHLSTFVYLSQVFGERFEPHLNLGVDLNADDVDRSSFLYTVGAAFLVGTKLGLVVDFIGRSEFARLPTRVPPSGIYQGFVLDRAPGTCTATQPCFLDFSKGVISFPFFPKKIKRNDITDFSFGVRYTLGISGSLFLGGIVPLNDDGFRADFIPSGGIEYTF